MDNKHLKHNASDCGSEKVIIVVTDKFIPLVTLDNLWTAMSTEDLKQEALHIWIVVESPQAT